jgi:hypothetical protein
MVTMTTEHYTLSMVRSQTIAEVNGRAMIFVAALSIFALHRPQRRAFARADFSRVDAQMHQLERS